jgi:hypothetical protein
VSSNKNKNTKGKQMSTIKSIAKALGLKVTEVSVNTLNPVIFATQVNHNNFGNVVKDGGKTFVLDTKANTADELTADSISKATIDGLKTTTPTAFQSSAMNVSESFGTITGLTLTRDADASANGSVGAIGTLADSLGLDVADISLNVQNGVIFQTAGLKVLSNLTKHDGKYFALDTKANTATVIDPEKVAELAKADFLAGKESDFTALCEAFGLVASVTFAPKKDA